MMIVICSKKYKQVRVVFPPIAGPYKISFIFSNFLFIFFIKFLGILFFLYTFLGIPFLYLLIVLYYQKLCVFNVNY